MDSGGGNAGSSDSAKPIPAETATNSLPGCGCASASNITVRVTPTTGGQFDLQVAKTESVENLKKIISKKLKVPKERICLLHRDRQLRDGTLQENQLMDGSRLTLLPSVETGLLAQRPEQSVMQALESLNDSQVNDFLSGKAPLNLTMRLGDHMMLIQLQLSTVTPSSSRRSSPSLLTSSSRNSLASSLSSVMTGSTSATAATSKSSSPPSSKQSSPKSSSPLLLSSSSSSSSSVSSTPVSTSTSTTPQPPQLIPLSSETRTSVSAASTTSTTTSSSRFKFSTPLSAFLPKPMETSPSSDSKEISPSTSTSSAYSSPDPAQVHPPRTTVPVSQSPLKSLEDAANLLTRTTVGSTSSSSSSSSGSNNHASTSTVAAHSCSSSGALTTGSSTACKCEPPAKPTLDTRALAEASRNLTQTLKQLSSEVLTSRSDPAEDSTRSRRQGAIIESMHHHGKGVYSGTFSGTLNPALQDRFGRPKRDISTIIHILNDLLCATPQYRRHARQGHTITVEASSSNTQKQNSTTNATEKTQTNMEFMDESGSLSRENQATRGKMEHLRLIMEERRARRRARREARAAPYTTQWSAKSESVSQPATMGRDAVEPMETGEQSTGSEQQLCELNPPEPVVA